MAMKQYIVTADYYDYEGMFNGNQYWIVDDEHTFYEAKDNEGKIQELIPQIKFCQDEDTERVEINVYEINSKITDKFNI